MGHYEFNRSPYGHTHAPQAFQRLMAEVLEGCRDYANPYLDDILIHSKTIAVHEVHVRSFLERLRLFNLKLKINKCTFLQEETKFLGFVINEEGIKADEDKVKDIRNIPAPRTVKQVRGFIGATSFFRRFYNNYSKLAKPLIKLTRKNAKFDIITEYPNERPIYFISHKLNDTQRRYSTIKRNVMQFFTV